MNWLVKTGRKVCKGIADHSPSLLTGLGIIGFVSTVILAVKETPEAQERIYKKTREKMLEGCELYSSDDIEVEVGLTRWETIKAAAPAYLPAVGMGIISIGCFVGANSINLKRNAAMVSIAEMYRAHAMEYQDAVIRHVGEKEANEIRKEIADRHYKEHPPIDEEIVRTGNGEYLCYEPYSNTYFLSCSENIHKAENLLNQQMQQERYMSFNDWLDILDIPSSMRSVYNYIGWHVDTDGLVDIADIYSSSENGTPCLTISYITEPHDNFKDVY